MIWEFDRVVAVRSLSVMTTTSWTKLRSARMPCLPSIPLRSLRSSDARRAARSSDPKLAVRQTRVMAKAGITRGAAEVM